MKQEIRNRKLDLCPSTADLPVDELIEECPECNFFVLYCCGCHYERLSDPTIRPCHHFRVVLTDGACLENGQPGAKAGAGVALGTTNATQYSIPITDVEDSFPVRSNQRAELYAAITGLEVLAEYHRVNAEEPSSHSKDKSGSFIIAGDSEYVVRGMTEWLPTWRRKNWRTSKGTEPVNLDLFLTLDKLVTEQEEQNVKVAFWYIPREYNRCADHLAKQAAVHGDLASAPQKRKLSDMTLA